MDTSSLKQKVIKGFLWLTTAAFLTQAISWLATIFVIRLLSPSDYGLLAMASTFVFIITTVSNLGINASLVQAKDLGDRDIRNVFGVIITAVALCSILCYFLASPIAAFYGEERVKDIIRVMILNFCLIGFYLIPQALAVRDMNFKLTAKITTFSQIGSSLTTLFLAYMGFGVWSLVAGMLTLNLFKLVGFNSKVASPKKPLFNFREAKKHVLFGITVTGDRLLYSLYNQIDKIIIGKLMGDKLLGIYSVAINLSSMPNNKILPIVNQVSFTSYSRIQDNKERLRRNVLRATRVVAGIGFPAFFGMAAVAPQLIPLLLGDQWVAATIPFQILCLVMPLKALGTIYPPAVFALGEAKVNMINMLLTCLVMAAAFIGATRWGIYGVCAAWITVYPVILLFTTNRCLNVIQMPLHNVLKEIVFPLLASIAMIGAIYFFQVSFHQHSQIALLFSSIILGCGTYLLLVLLFYREKYQEILKIIR